MKPENCGTCRYWTKAEGLATLGTCENLQVNRLVIVPSHVCVKRGFRCRFYKVKK